MKHGDPDTALLQPHERALDAGILWPAEQKERIWGLADISEPLTEPVPKPVLLKVPELVC